MGKEKKISFEVVPADHEAYELLARVMEWHPRLEEARIGLAWRLRTSPDVDGKVVLGRCVKISDLQKEWTPFDFVIVLNSVYWDGFSEAQQLALLDHELCHAAPALDSETGAVVRDTRGRMVWRVRKHDVEEFAVIVQRHGTWKSDLEAFARAMKLHDNGQMSIAIDDGEADGSEED